MKTVAYILYVFFAKRLPRSYEFGFVGMVSEKIRNVVCRMMIKGAPKTIFVERGADFGSGKNIILKDHACIGENARFMGEGKITIGRHVMMGPDVMIITSDHKMSKEGFDGYVSKDVMIDDYAWIGARAIILKGVKIGKYAVVGAGAVVTKDMPDHAIAGGSPAEILKYRGEEKR